MIHRPKSVFSALSATFVASVFSSLTLVATSASAQPLSERAVLIERTQTTAMSALRDRFTAEAAIDDERIQAYLLQNPGVQRTFVKDGSLYELRRIDDEGNPLYINTKNGAVGAKNVASGQLIKADSLYPGGSIGASITGTGMVAGIWDGGTVRDTHELLAGQVTNQAGQTMPVDNHMTHVSGTMVGKLVATQPSARGIAFGATSKNYDWTADKAEMTAFAAGGFLVSNHSYGYANDATIPAWQFGAYDSEARAWDEITKNAPFYLPFVAGGNEQQSSGNRAAKLGYDIITGSSAAKNVMTVGALNGDKSMSDYSNWGPTDDGRVKPEIVAKGTGINSAQAFEGAPPVASNTAYSGNGASSSGTSYATPAAAAASLLLQQYYRSLNPAYMLASTLKTLMLGTAEDLGQIGPDHKFGWGLLNVEAAANAIKIRTTNPAPGVGNFDYTLANSRGSVIDEITVNPAADSTAEIQRTVIAKGGVPLVVNIGWTDDEGIAQVLAEGVDPILSRMVYEFDILVRQTGGGDKRSWKIPTMANRTADATESTSWFESSGGNFKQAIVAAPVANAQYTIFLRKKTFSPAAARTVSLVVTGLAETPAVGPACGTYTGGTTCNADADGDGHFEVRDAQLILRRLLGMTGTAITDGLIAPRACATRKLGSEVATFVDNQNAALPKPLDIDGDGQVHATSDGLMLLRVALGLGGDAVVANAAVAGSPRTTWAQVRPYLVTQCGLTPAP